MRPMTQGARLALIAIGMLLAGVAYAQVAAATAAPDALSPSILQNPVLLLAVNMAVRYVPGLRAFISNKFAPFLSTIIAWVPGLLALFGAAAPAPHAWLLTGHQPVMAAGFFGALGALGLSLGGALQSSALQWFMYEAMLRTHLPPKPADSK